MTEIEQQKRIANYLAPLHTCWVVSPDASLNSETRWTLC